MFSIYFSISYGVATMAFVCLLEKLKDMNIFLAPSIETAQAKNGRLIESSPRNVMKSRCDLPRASKQ